MQRGKKIALFGMQITVAEEKGESRGSEEEKWHSWIKDLCNCWITESSRRGSWDINRIQMLSFKSILLMLSL